jgi:hypothetical protein
VCASNNTRKVQKRQTEIDRFERYKTHQALLTDRVHWMEGGRGRKGYMCHKRHGDTTHYTGSSGGGPALE